jgi:hypothetical protein
LAGHDTMRASGPADPPRPATIEERAGPCPVTILGHDDGLYSFLTPEGQLRTLKARHLDSTGLMSIFGTEGQWLWDAFPKRAKDGDNVIDWNVKPAQEFLIRRAHAVGLFRPERTVRGPGVWLDVDEHGKRSLVVHCGDMVLLPSEGGDGPTRTLVEWRSAGIKWGDYIYPASPAETRPAAHGASKAQATEFYDFVKSWAWRSPVHAPRLLLGFVAASMICGALKWRPHIQIAGGSGTGKTSLEFVCRGVLGSQVLAVSAPTEAAIRQELRGAARPVFVDEIETDNMLRSRQVLELARLASSEAQAPVTRGSVDGKATRWPIRGCFAFSSVLHPRYRPQDLARICILELDPLPVGERSDGELLQAWVVRETERFERMGPALRRRMIDGYDRFTRNLVVFEAAIGALGERARVAAQLGTLLACAETMLSDEVITAEAAAKLVEAFAIADITGHSDEEDQNDCLAHLLTTQVRVEFEKTTIAGPAAVSRSRRSPSWSRAGRAAGPIGSCGGMGSPSCRSGSATRIIRT